MGTRSRRLLTGATAVLLGLGAAVVVADSAAAATPASSSIAVLMKSYDAGTAGSAAAGGPARSR